MRAIIPTLFWLTACGPSALIQPPADSELTFEQQHNYVWTGTLALAETELAAETDFTIDWSGLTPDPRTLTPAGHIELVYIARLGYPAADVAEMLLTERATSRYQSHYAPVDNAVQVIESTQLHVGPVQFNTGLFVEDPADGWVVVVAGAEGPIDLLSIQILTPRAAATNTLVDIVDGDTTLTSTVDLHTMPAIETTAGSASYRLDWSALTHDTHGNDLDPDRLNELILARVDVATPQDVEPLFADLEHQAAELYRLPLDVGVTHATLDAAVDASTAASRVAWVTPTSSGSR